MKKVSFVPRQHELIDVNKIVDGHYYIGVILNGHRYILAHTAPADYRYRLLSFHDESRKGGIFWDFAKYDSTQEALKDVSKHSLFGGAFVTKDKDEFFKWLNGVD